MPIVGQTPAPPTYVNFTQIVAQPDRLVFLAHHQVFGGPCVQKSVLLVGMPDALMLTEPQLLEQLDHDHIVRIREAQFDPHMPGWVTYVMPRYPGGSVQEHLALGETFSISQALTLTGHLLDALSYLHDEVAFVHRDVKPANVLLDASLQVGALSDFGSAAKLLPGGSVITRGCTLPYLDPAAAVSGAMTVQSDVYGAGLTAFEMLSGTLLPCLDPAKATVRLGQGKRAYPDGVLAYAPHVPATVRRLVNKAIATTPTQRFLTAANMATAVAKAGRSVVDWRHVAGTGLDGEWRGTWPPWKTAGKRRILRVESAVSTSGRRAATRHLEASYESGSGWRRFGGLVADVPPSDHKAVSKFFDRVDAAVAQVKAIR